MWEKSKDNKISSEYRKKSSKGWKNKWKTVKVLSISMKILWEKSKNSGKKLSQKYNKITNSRSENCKIK